MKPFLVLMMLLTACAAAWADGSDTFAQWPGWEIRSSEDCYLSGNHTPYPLTYLIDGDPKTAWMSSGKLNPRQMALAYESSSKRPYRQWIEFCGNTTIDSIRVMNGNNSSPQAFARNNRIVRVRIIIDDQEVKTVSLSDKMGWHTITIPRTNFHRLKLEFTGIKKGPNNHTFVSEIALYDGNRKIDFHVPQLFLFSSGDECGDGLVTNIMSRSGKIIHSWNSQSAYDWSPSKRLIACLDENSHVFVADITTGRALYDKPIKLRSKEDYCSLTNGFKWEGESSIILTLRHHTGRMINEHQEEIVDYRETINLNTGK